MRGPFIHCVVTGEQLQTTDEALEVGYFHPDEIPSDQYHADTEPRIQLAVSYWRLLNEQTSQEESDGNGTYELGRGFQLKCGPQGHRGARRISPLPHGPQIGR